MVSDRMLRRAAANGAMVAAGLLVVVLTTSAALAQITVRGQLAHDMETVPGATLTGSVTIDNETSELQQARVYQRDYLFFADGTNSYDDPGSTARSNADWITFSPEQATVPPNGSVTVSYQINVPDSAGDGSWWSMLMVEAIDRDSRESTLGDDAPPEREVGFRQVTRYGVQLATHVNPTTAEPGIDLDNVSLQALEDGRTMFQIDVLNVGRIMMRPDVYMRLFDTDGNEYGPFQGVQYRLYPNTSTRQRIELVGVPAGTYQAVFVVDAGGDAVFGGQFELTL
ncbi:MAG: hypothetical protein COV99_10915 [Bacteroidetes bacterium CG12_big_fil_rev_8_21_14_0_65_60_17]|nr:MAG: hypothetical protein COV99_10915 [Bacteroidetes bacterium CG12_big_fil_rev_8_21_14_0_65_60_17]